MLKPSFQNDRKSAVIDLFFCSYITKNWGKIIEGYHLIAGLIYFIFIIITPQYKLIFK